MTHRPFPSHVQVDAAVSIRLAHESDAELISVWTRDPGVNRFWGGRPVPVEEVLAKYTGRRSPEVVSYLIIERARPVGYVQAWQEPGRCGLDMFLAAAAQGRGLGPRAAGALATELTALGWAPLTVDPTVDNARAIGAWRAAGFVPTGEVGVDDGKPTQIMEFQGSQGAPPAVSAP